MATQLGAMIPAAELNDDDVTNARRLIARHTAGDGDGPCSVCGQTFPCLPRRIAETMLRTAAERK